MENRSVRAGFLRNFLVCQQFSTISYCQETKEKNYNILKDCYENCLLKVCVCSPLHFALCEVLFLGLIQGKLLKWDDHCQALARVKQSMMLTIYFPVSNRYLTNNLMKEEVCSFR